MARVVAFRALATAVNIATSLLAAAVLGPSGRGEQTALAIAPGFLGGIASLGLHGALIYNLKADPARERELLGSGILLTLCAGGLAVVAGWLLEPHWLRQYSAHTILVGRLLMLVTPMIVIGWTLSGAAEARGWFGLVNRMFYVQSLATLALLGALTLLHRLTPATAACAYLLPQVPTFLVVFARIASRMRPVFRPRRDLLARLLRYGVRLAGVDLLGTLAAFIDQLMIVAFLPPGMVGTYAVALSSARLLNVVQGGVSSVLFPSIAARELGTVARTVATAFRVATLLIAALAGVLAVIGPPLLVLAYGAAFAPAVLPFRLLLLAMVLENGARILHQIYAGSGRPELVTLLECAAVAVLVLAMLALLPAFGTTGAAAAVLCGAAFRLAAAIGGLPLLLRIRLPRLLFGRADLRLIQAALSRPALAASPAGLEPVP
jgi:O-antigen/teichoic acid export membrane protein